MIELLHKRIDDREAMAEDAAEVVDKTVRGKIAEALAATDEIEDPREQFAAAMEMLAEEVANLLAPITTEAVRKGAQFARERKKEAGG